MSIRSLRNDEAPCPVTIDSLAALNNVLNRIKLKLSGNATTSLDSTDFHRHAVGWNEYSKKFMQRVSMMKANPRLEPVKPEGDHFTINPAYLMDKQKITSFRASLEMLYSIRTVPSPFTASKRFMKNETSPLLR